MTGRFETALVHEASPETPDRHTHTRVPLCLPLVKTVSNHPVPSPGGIDMDTTRQNERAKQFFVFQAAPRDIGFGSPTSLH